ncbi:MAG TPA: peroxiredoxin-like family protein, partial [Albitalea sp.]|nr:peroxiredoxin-like family protein [Albitalea sp.]
TALEAIEAANRRLAQSGLTDRALRAGQRAPDFVLADATGRPVDSKQLRSRGPLVISFYRGAWCPYCNLELQAWQRHLPELDALGATLVAISPQVPDASLTLAQKHALAYPVLSDFGHRVARQFGIVYEVDEAVRPVYQAFGVDLPAYNGDASFELPVPATYLVDRDGTIAGEWIDTDYRRRAEPSVVLSRLGEIGEVRA